MTYQQLTYFYYAAKTLNFSKAAQLCFVAQTAISMWRAPSGATRNT